MQAGTSRFRVLEGCTHRMSGSFAAALAAGLMAATPLSAGAQTGSIEINQARAVAGGVTAGDAAGFPVTISEPGSYSLTGNLTLSAGDVPGPGRTHAIEITASNVTLMLNGFAIQGPGICGFDATTGAATCVGHLPTTGVFIALAGQRATILGPGRITGLFNAIASGAPLTVVKNLEAYDNATDAIQLGGSSVTEIGGGSSGAVEDCKAFRNGGVGILVNLRGAIRGSVATNNGSFGMSAGLETTITNSVATVNSLGGFTMNVGLFSANVVGDNFGDDPVFLGTDAGNNTCKKRGQGTGPC